MRCGDGDEEKEVKEVLLDPSSCYCREGSIYGEIQKLIELERKENYDQWKAECAKAIRNREAAKELLMWVYEKRLQYPVNITQKNAKLAQVIISQFGGPDGELAASQRYLSQRYTMPDGMTKGLLNDIGTEELAHIEIVCAIIYQLTKNLSVEEIKASGFDKYYVDHTLGIWPQAAGGIPFNACVFQVKGDPITDLTEDLAAEQKARSTYDNILRLISDPEICKRCNFHLL